jgi:hypothetical protein
MWPVATSNSRAAWRTVACAGRVEDPCARAAGEKEIANTNNAEQQTFMFRIPLACFEFPSSNRPQIDFIPFMMANSLIEYAAAGTLAHEHI